ncbi:MAG: SDR family oxidoreductase [Gemmatimonadaceae bacterium]
MMEGGHGTPSHPATIHTSKDATVILVLGATGTTGGEVARALIGAGERPRLLVRSREKARAFEKQAQIVTGDLADIGSLRAAMTGIDRLYLVSTGAELVKLERNAVDAAVKAGVRHIVKLSVIGADDPSITFARWHQAAEESVMRSGLAWTMLRPGSFMTNALGWVPTIKTQSAFFQPTGIGRWAAIDPGDIAAVALRALTTSGHEGKAYTLTGPESMDAAGYAAILARTLGKPVSFVDVPPEAAKKGMVASGMPPAYVEALLDLLAAMKAGMTDLVTPTVKRLLGREPTTFADWSRRHVAAFR